MKTRMFLLAALIAAVMVAGFSHGAFASGGGTVIRAGLAPSAAYPAASGKAKYKVDGTQREFEAEVDNVKKLAGKTVYIFVNGVKVGSAVVDAFGTGRLSLSTKLRQSVPYVKAGDVVRIKTAAGILIVSGKF